jgi:two-component system response regulator ResD
MRRILLVDSDARFRADCKKTLAVGGDLIMEAADGVEAIGICHRQAFDVIVLDADLKDIDSFSALTVINRLYSTPVIMLSHKNDAEERVRGLELGASEYLVKPVLMRELALRVNAAIRIGKTLNEANRLLCDGLEINYIDRYVVVDGRRVDMTAREYDLLFFMARNRETVLNRDELMSGAWGYDCFVESRNVDSYVKTLRKKLGPYASFIVTRRGKGYEFIPKRRNAGV